jgi:D-lactate dehydrogenase
MPRAARPLPRSASRERAAAVYLPACVNRIFGNARGAEPHPTVAEALVALSRRAGRPLWIPPGVAGHCCGLPWSSKGFERGNEVMSDRTAAALRSWSDGGELPVVVDASSCAHALREGGAPVLDSVEWVHDHLLERLELRRRLASVAIHPTCSTRHLGLEEKLRAIAARMAKDVIVPSGGGCCGMAGDRGWLYPELPESALRDVARELDGAAPDAFISSNRTCEVALQHVTGRPYRSFALALEELTRA